MGFIRKPEGGFEYSQKKDVGLLNAFDFEQNQTISE
jgi:hypothetical protein